MNKIRLYGLILLLGLAGTAAASDQGLDEQVRALKREVLQLNKELFLLEEELLYPSSTQLAVFVSLDVGELFKLDAVTLKIDDQVVAHYLYTDRELAALRKGGVQRLWVGNVKQGAHQVVATFTGTGPQQRDYRRGATLDLNKGLGPKYLELKISDRTQSQQPEFTIKEWEQ